MPALSAPTSPNPLRPRDALHGVADWSGELSRWLFGPAGLDEGIPIDWEAVRAGGFDVVAIEAQWREAWPVERELRMRTVARAAARLQEALNDPTGPRARVELERLLDAGLARHLGKKGRRSRLHALLEDLVGERAGRAFRVCERCDTVFDSGRISRYCSACSKKPPATLEELEAAAHVRENAWGVRWDDWGDPENRTLEWMRICACGTEFVTDDRRVTYCKDCGAPAERVRRHRAASE